MTNTTEAPALIETTTATAENGNVFVCPAPLDHEGRIALAGGIRALAEILEHHAEGCTVDLEHVEYFNDTMKRMALALTHLPDVHDDLCVNCGRTDCCETCR